MSHTAITLKFKMRWFPNEGRYRAGTLLTDINLVPLIPDEDKTFSGSLVFGFKNLMTSREKGFNVAAAHPYPKIYRVPPPGPGIKYFQLGEVFEG